MIVSRGHQKGSVLPVCEDFALAESVGFGENYAFVIIGGANPFSMYADMGTRLLAFSAKRTFALGGFDMKPDFFGQITIHNLRDSIKQLDLRPKTLDGSLLTLAVKDENYVVNIYGNGVFFHKTEKTLRIVLVDFESNMPAYLSYYLDEDRKKDYATLTQGSKHILEFSSYRSVPTDIITVENYIEPFDSVSYRGLVQKGDVLGILSDGVSSFKRCDNSPILREDIVRELINDDKSTVQSNLSKLESRWNETGIRHIHDLSMATISV